MNRRNFLCSTAAAFVTLPPIPSFAAFQTMLGAVPEDVK